PGAGARAARSSGGLVRAPSPGLREPARQKGERAQSRGAACRAKREGGWAPPGCSKGIRGAPIRRHKQGRKIQEQHGVPPLASVEKLRDLLQIRSPGQLGFFLLATHDEDDEGPYVKFTLPKRDGSPRTICAPTPHLRQLQR